MRSDRSSLHPIVETVPEGSRHCWHVPPSTLSFQKQVAQPEEADTTPHFRHARCCE